MGKKLESNFTNMVVVLFSVTLIASAAVGYVYSLTAGPIEAAKQAKQEKRRTDRNSSKNLYQQRIRRKNMVNGRIQSGW